jgi:predicted small metal-binding protein
VALRIVCMCGYVIQGSSDDELWANAQRHMGVLHPELVGNVTREDILAQAELLGPGAVQEPLVNGAQGRVGRDPEVVPEQDP